MTSCDPVENLYAFLAYGFLVTFSAASQHILLLAYQIETLYSRDWGIGEGMSVFGYRMGILTAGPIALSLATYLSWQGIYIFLAFLMLVGLIPVLMGGELEPIYSPSSAKKRDWLRYAIIEPFKDFMHQERWITILVFMLLYRLPDNLLSMMQTLFLLDLGFTKIEISLVAKTFGMGTAVFGGFVGGYWIRLFQYKKTLLWGAVAHCIACLLFLVQAKLGANLPFLYVAVGIEHFCSGIMLTAFLSYQLTCANITFAATQLALLTAFTNLGGVFVKPLAGMIIDRFGWVAFLVLVVLSALPGILWVYRIPVPQSLKGEE